MLGVFNTLAMECENVNAPMPNRRPQNSIFSFAQAKLYKPSCGVCVWSECLSPSYQVHKKSDCDFSVMAKLL